MSFEFLRQEHLQKYGQYHQEPTPEQLKYYFQLNEKDRAFIRQRRRPSNKLGVALQLCTLRYLGTFLTDPMTAPDVVLKALSKQLSIKNPRQILQDYARREQTHWEHYPKIRDHLGYQDFQGKEVIHLARWLYSTLSIKDERPIVLFDQAIEVLRKRQVVLPGATVLARMIVKFREHHSTLLFHTLTRRLTAEQKAQLADLLVIPGRQRKTPLELLRTPIVTDNPSALVAALDRVTTIQNYKMSKVDTSDIPSLKLERMARHALQNWVGGIAKLSEPRRYATLLAVMQHLEKTSVDDALDVFDAVMGTLQIKGRNKRRKERFRTLKDLDQSSQVLAEVVDFVLDDNILDIELRSVIYKYLQESQIKAAREQVRELTSPVASEEIEAWSYVASQVERFLKPLIQTVKFDAIDAAKPILAALRFYGKKYRRKSQNWKTAPRDFVPLEWKSLVMPRNKDIDPHQYAVCLAHELQVALKKREIFVPGSPRYGDPRAQLLDLDHWATIKEDLCRTMELPTDPHEELQALQEELDQAFLSVDAQLEGNATLRIEEREGISTPIITPLEALEIPESLKGLISQVERRLPEVDLSEMLLEIQSHTEFCNDFTHVSDGKERLPDLAKSVCAVLVAQACNIGLKAVVKPGDPALSIGRLSWVQQHYVRAETLTKANARLVDFHSTLPLAQVWGEGEVASADGIRFVVPMKTIHARFNRKYFGRKPGMTWYNFTSNQYSGFHGMVVPGTLRDSLFLLGGLLEQQTSLQPKEIMTDTHGYTDMVFGLFHLMGYQFSPRLADVGGSRFWRMGTDVDYGALQDVARNKVKVHVIAENWDDLLRLAGSLKLNSVRAVDVMKVLTRGNNTPTALGKAVSELGRIAKTLYLLNYVVDEDYRRRILLQLNRGEGRHRVARWVCHGNKGEIKQKYKEGMEDQMGALGLVLNIIVLWNTRYMSAILDWLEVVDEKPDLEDVKRISPLRFQHINVLGRYHFELAEEVKWGGMRALRDPENVDLIEEW